MDMFTIELSDDVEIVISAPTFYDASYTFKTLNKKSGEVVAKQFDKEEVNRIIKFLVVHSL